MDAKLKAIAKQAIAKETPLKGYELGVLDAGIREETGELVVILLDGRKMVYPAGAARGYAPNMKAKAPTPNMTPAPTAESGGGGSKPPTPSARGNPAKDRQGRKQTPVK